MNKWIDLVNQDNTRQHHNPSIIHFVNPYLIDIILIQCLVASIIKVEVTTRPTPDSVRAAEGYPWSTEWLDPAKKNTLGRRREKDATGGLEKRTINKGIDKKNMNEERDK